MKKENRIRKTFRGILAIAKNPWLLNHVLSDSSIWGKYISGKYNITKGLPVINITDIFPGFKEELNTYAFLDGGSSALDLSLIKSLCKTFPGCTYFEIGTCRGESVANAADVCSKCYTLDLKPSQQSDQIEASVSGYFSKKFPNVTHLHEDSTTFDYESIGQKFDVIFIDGDHRYEFVKSDTANVFKHLVHPHSIVIWHDYASDVITPRNEVFAGILDGVRMDLHKNLYHVSNTICAVYIPKQLPTTDILKVRIPDKKFKVSIEAVKIDKS